VLAAGEIGFETDTLLFKIGDGSQQWQNLEYAGGTEPIRNNPSGTSVTDLDAAALRNNGNSKYLISGADIVANGPSGLTTGADGQLMVTVAKFDYTGASGSGNERFLMTLQTLTTGRFFYRTYNGSWSSWYEAIRADPATGNVTIAGDIAVNGGDITTNQTTASVFNATATTLNVGQAATAVSIGATTGTATIRNATTAITNAATVGGTLAVTGNTTLTGDLAVNGGDITTTSATGNVFETTATTVTLGRSVPTVCIADNVTAAQTIDIGTGATVSGATKTINIGTGGAAGSTTNVNIGDADGGTVAVGKNMTVGGTFAVTGQTTLTGGISGQLAYDNMPSGTVINMEVSVPTEVEQSATLAGTTTVTIDFPYTPKRSNSTIFVYGFVVVCYAISGGNGALKTASVSLSYSAGSPGGSLTLSREGGGALSASSTSSVVGQGAVVSGNYLITHIGGNGSARTYRITATATIASGGNGNRVCTITPTALVFVEKIA
jgi:hypothetical protein